MSVDGLSRFVSAQESTYADALRELRTGRKRSHWMWFIFPQIAGLGSSSTSRFYAIEDRSEAESYLAHPLLGPRLAECCEALLSLGCVSATDVFGYPDDLKLRSSMTLFALVSPPENVFQKVLDKFFGGEMDERTVQLLKDG